MLTVAKRKKPAPLDPALLRTFREAAGVTQAEAAKQAGVHIQTYMRWERGETEPTFGEARALAKMFGKSLNDFAVAGGEDPE